MSLARVLSTYNRANRARITRPQRRRRSVPRRPGRSADRARGGAGAARRPRDAERAGRARRPAADPDRPPREVPSDRPRARPDRRQPDADRPVPAGRSERQATNEDGRGDRVRATLVGPAVGPGRLDARRVVAAAPTRTRSRSAIGTRPRWARSTCSRPASTGPCPVWTTSLGPTSTTRASTSTSGAHGSDATRASSRTCSRTRPSSPGSATPTATRSCTRPDCCRSGSARPSPTEEVDALYDAARTTVTDAIEVLRRRVPPTFETQVRDFLAVHDKGGTPCPRCGTRITEVKPGGFVTSYCRGCQR